MPSSSRASRAAIFLVAMCCAGEQRAQMSLDKLNACGELAVVQDLVNNGGLQRHCRSPRSALEREIQRRSRQTSPAQQFCFVDAPNVDSLSGFSCVTATISGSGTLTCYRPTDAAEIERYKVDYHDIYQPKVQNYLDSAAKCPLSNRDAAIDSFVLAPAFIAEVARTEVGYRLGVGTAEPPVSTINHGFALIDPVLGSQYPGAIEYVSFYSAGQGVASSDDAKQERFGPILVSHGRDRDFERMFLKSFPPGFQIRMTSTSYEFRKRPLSKGSAGDFRQVSNVVRSTVDRVVTGEGIAQTDDDDIEGLTGHRMEDVIARFQDGLPFGIRKPIGGAYRRSASIYLSDRIPSCPNGAMGVLELTIEPTVETLDLGSATYMLYAVGECASSSVARRYQRALVQEINAAILLRLGESIGR